MKLHNFANASTGDILPLNEFASFYITLFFFVFFLESHTRLVEEATSLARDFFCTLELEFRVASCSIINIMGMVSWLQ
jgi:hypothetical protein